MKSVFLVAYYGFNRLLFLLSGVRYNKASIFGLLLLGVKGKMSIGRKARINSYKFSNIIGGDKISSIIVKKGGHLVIGNNFRMSNSAIYCANNITIGDNVMIGGSCKIWDSDFHPIDPVIRLQTPNQNFKTAPINIGNNVFIGGCSIILKGVTIGDNAVVGAGSVVSGHIPANEIWAGNPAKLIKKLNS